MGITLNGPIPGQSLTREPGNSPWEQPPLYADNEKALAWHLENLEKGDHMDDLMFLLDRGFPIETFVDSLTTNAVMSGYHTIDTSTLISPVIHEYVKKFADAGGVKYTEWAGPSDEERDQEKFKKRLSLMIGDRDVMSKVGNEEPAKVEQPIPAQTGGLIPRRK